MRVSVTLLDSYRLFLREDWKSEQSLIDAIKGVFVRTPVMELGTAFHAILEDPQGTRVTGGGGYCANGKTFSAQVVEPCLGYLDRRGVFEVKAEKEYPLWSGGGVTVVGKADQLIGNQIVENKTKWSAFDHDAYAESLQWRFYLDMFTAKAVRYNVFCLSEGARGITLRSVETMAFFPYPTLREDCERWVRDFATYVRSRGLESYLTPALESVR